MIIEFGLNQIRGLWHTRHLKYVSCATNHGEGSRIKRNHCFFASNVYLNSFGGTRVRLYLPYLKNFSDSQVVSISRAELTIKIDEILSPYNVNYGYPANLAILACGSDGSEELVYDQLESSDFVKYGGDYNSTSKLYTFNIARQMQKIVSGTISNYGFYLVNANPSKSVVIRRDNRLERVVLGGKNNTTYKPSFKVTYIKYPYDK